MKDIHYNLRIFTRIVSTLHLQKNKYIKYGAEENKKELFYIWTANAMKRGILIGSLSGQNLFRQTKSANYIFNSLTIL